MICRYGSNGANDGGISCNGAIGLLAKTVGREQCEKDGNWAKMGVETVSPKGTRAQSVALTLGDSGRREQPLNLQEQRREKRKWGGEKKKKIKTRKNIK